ncbi:hypothetical protein QJS66_16715 [Kocuria rhizophila]|nr:hypothetical protein QJS66_16715 [Kocuria rhizophila]
MTAAVVTVVLGVALALWLVAPRPVPELPQHHRGGARAVRAADPRARHRGPADRLDAPGPPPCRWASPSRPI